jgi:hypothetical protein
MEYRVLSERSQRLFDQMELELEELAEVAGEDVVKGAEAAPVQVRSFTRRKAERRAFPPDLTRRRIVHPALSSSPCCGGTRLSRIGEDMTETLDVVPGRWFAVFFYSPDRRGENLEGHLTTFTGVLQADGYAGFGSA